MAMMINQRLKETSSDQEDEDGLERIDLEALRRLDQKQGNPLKPYREEEASKPSDKYGLDNQKQPSIRRGLRYNLLERWRTAQPQGM